MLPKVFIYVNLAHCVPRFLGDRRYEENQTECGALLQRAEVKRL